MTFQSQIRPQLHGLVSEFYDMVIMFPDYPRGMSKIVSLSNRFESSKQTLIEKCPRYLNAECLPVIEEMIKNAQDLSALTLSFYGEIKMAHEPYISGITGLRFINQYNSELEKFKGQLELASLTYRAKKLNIKIDPILLAHDHMRTYLSLSVVEFIPYLYKDNFKQFYMNFVRPMENNLSTPTAHTFVFKNIKDLNFNLNLLHQNLTKRNKKTPTGMGSNLNQLQNRWNLVMRGYYL